MEKVLLVIDGVAPDRKVFNYALELCLRIKAELKVLQIVRGQSLVNCFKTIKNTADQARQYFESSMMATAFAQAGEHETADDIMSEALKNFNKLLPEAGKIGVLCHHTMKSGATREEVVNYVRENKDVVIAVYDSAGENNPKSQGRKKKNALQSISRALSVPVVMVQDDA